MRFLSLFLTAAVALLLTGCATVDVRSTRAPGADLSTVKRVFVERLPADERGIEKIIAEQARQMGFEAESGIRDRSAPVDYDALITYQDKWMWDITMYMIELNVQVRDGRTGSTLATGKSLRTSLARRSPEEMAREVLETIFHGKKN